MITIHELAEIRAQLDSTVPHYVPRLLDDLTEALETLQYVSSYDCPTPESCRAWPKGQCGPCRAWAALHPDTRDERQEPPVDLRAALLKGLSNLQARAGKPSAPDAKGGQ